MNWHRLVVMVGVACLLGCASNRSLRAASDDAGGAAVVSQAAPAAGPAAVATASLNVRDDSPRLPPGSRVAARVRATVNGTAILDDEVRDACYPRLMQTLNLPAGEQQAEQKKIIEDTLQQIIEREIVLSEALEKLKSRPQVIDKLKEAASKEFDKQLRLMRKRAPQIKSNDDLKKALEAQGMSLEGYRRQVERGFMMMEYMRSRIYPILEQEIGHEQVEEYYRTHPAEFARPERLQWQDIFIAMNLDHAGQPARQTAEQVVRRAQAGEDWMQLSKRFDDGDSVYRKGEGSGQKRGEIRPVEVEPVLLKLREGQIGLVEVGNGYHVVRLVKHELAGQVPFNAETQTAIRDKLRGELAERESKKILAQLKSRAQVHIITDTP